MEETIEKVRENLANKIKQVGAEHMIEYSESYINNGSAIQYALQTERYISEFDKIKECVGKKIIDVEVNGAASPCIGEYEWITFTFEDGTFIRIKSEVRYFRDELGYIKEDAEESGTGLSFEFEGDDE